VAGSFDLLWCRLLFEAAQLLHRIKTIAPVITRPKITHDTISALLVVLDESVSLVVLLPDFAREALPSAEAFML
jgi:hypothetical protein